MSKKLILFLMLAVFGSTNLLKAEEVLIGDPAGGTDTYLPVCSLANYTVTQQIYTAEEIGMAGTINSFTMWLSNTSGLSRDVKIYMKNVSMDAFETIGGWAKMSEADFVATGTIGSGVSKPVSPEAVTFTLSTPFEYDGVSNLVICFADVTGTWRNGVAGVIFQGEKYRAMYYTSSGAIDITSIPAASGSKKYRNVVRLDITPPPAPFDVTPTDFGYRPNGAGMEPVNFEVLGDGYTVTAMNIDNDYFTFDGPEVPFTTPATFAVTTGNAATGDVTGHVAFFYEGSRANARFDIKATAYDPTEGDVVEKAKIVPAGFSTYTDQPSEIYHNYNLPGEDSDNPDAVYRLNFYNLPKDVLLKADIQGGDRGEGKVALYKEEADGTCHPMRDNAYEYAGMFEGKTLDGNGMYVEKGGIYYLVAQAADGFTVNINALNAPEPGKPEVTYPTPASLISPDNVTAKWDIKEFTTEIRVLLKSEEDDWDTIKNWTPCITETDTLDEVQLSNLEEGTSYYLRVDAKNAAGEVESDVVTFNTTASAPTNLSVNKNAIFEGDTVTFSWNYTISSGLFIGYNIYCDGDQLNPIAIPAKNFNYIFGSRTYNMNPGHKITVTAVFSNGTESAASEPIFVKVSGYANYVGGTVYYDTAAPKPLAGATVTFTGKDEFGNDVTLTTGSSNYGAYAFNDVLKAGSYTATAVLSGLSYSAVITDSIKVAHNDNIGGINFTDNMDLPAPENLTASNDKVFDGDTVTFSWDYTASSQLFVGYNLYINDSKIAQIQDSTISCQFDGYNMVPGYVIMVKAAYKNGGFEYESAASEPDTVKVSGYAANVSGTVYYDVNKPLAGATVTFTGEDEFGNNVTFTTESNKNGEYAFNEELKAGSYTATAELSNLYRAVITDPIEVIYKGNIGGINFTDDMVLPAPEDLTASNDKVFEGEIVTFSWDYTTSSQLFAGYNFYIDGSKINEDPIQEDSIPCRFDTYNMDGYEITVKAVYTAVCGDDEFEYESAASQPDTVKVSGYGSAFGLVKDCGNMTPLVGVELTLNGLDEFGDAVVFTTTTDDVGLFGEDGIKAGTYTVTASLNGFEDVTVEGPITITCKGEEYLDDICMHEKYYAPSNVTADTIDDNKVVRVKWDMNRSLQSFNIYVLQTAGEGIEPGDSLVNLLQEGYNAVSSTWYDNAWEARDRGVYQYGVAANYEGNQNPTRGTSEITWSNTLEKDMNMKSFTFKVSTSDEGGSVDGARVTMTNLSEPYINKRVFYMEETGEYQIANFRRGVYNIEVEPADDEHDAFTGVNVNLWNLSEYSVELKETELEVKNVYVSHTGFARWDKPTVKDRGFNGYDLYVDGMQVAAMYADTCYQILNLTEDVHKFTVGVLQNTGETTQTDKEFEYLGCEKFDPELVAGYHAPQAVAECHDVVVTWGEEESSTPERGSSIFSCDFEDITYLISDWVSIDKDDDGEDWITGTTQSGEFNGYDYSIGLVSKSYNYDEEAGVGTDLNADNYLLSPEVELPANGTVTLSWYAMATGGANWPDYYQVMIAPNASTDTSDFVKVFYEDGPAEWAQRTVDISAYAGTKVRVVFHHKDYAQYWIVIDNLDITSTPAEWDVTTWALYLDDKPIDSVSGDTMHYDLTINDTKEHTFRVVGIDAEYNMSCGQEVTFTAGSTNTPSGLAAAGIEGGVQLTWEGYSDKYIVYKGFAADNMILLDTVEDGATQFVDVQVLQGCYYGVSGLSDCGPSDMITKKFGEPEDLYYTPEPGYFSATMDVTGYVSINNEDPLNSNFEIGAFITDSYGERHCCGGARSLYYPAENHNIFQFKVHGDSENDVITFELFDHATGNVIDTLVSKTTLNFEVDGIAGTIEKPSVFKFFSTKTHTVQLKGIGNWVSTYIELSGEEGLGIIEDGLGENAVEIKVDNKFTTYVDGYGWWGSLETAGSENMFIIRMKSSEDTDVAFTGMVADPAEHPITINKNWNRIGYISSKTMDVNTALGTLNPAEGDLIKSKDAFATYYESTGWFGELETMEPGKGYMYHSESEVPQTLIYPVAAPSRGENAEGSATAADSHWTVESSRFAMNMSVTAAVSVDGSLVENGDIEVGAFCNGEVRGSARPVYVEPLDRYVIFLTVFGNEGDNISFRLFNPEDGSEYTAVEHLVYSDDAVKGGIKDPFMLNFGGDDNISVFPNPTKGNVIVSADGMKNISVVNTLGQTVYRQAANAGEMTIDMSQFGAGMYLINIETENGTAVKRVTVTR